MDPTYRGRNFDEKQNILIVLKYFLTDCLLVVREYNNYTVEKSDNETRLLKFISQMRGKCTLRTSK